MSFRPLRAHTCTRLCRYMARTPEEMPFRLFPHTSAQNVSLNIYYVHQSNDGRDPEHGSNYSGFHGWVIEATTGAVAPSTDPPNLHFPLLLLPHPPPPPISAPLRSCPSWPCALSHWLGPASFSLCTSFSISLSLPVTLNAHCVSLYGKLV